MLITLDEIKNYLRVDFDDDDELLTAFLASGQQLCMDVARITDVAVFEAEPRSCTPWPICMSIVRKLTTKC